VGEKQVSPPTRLVIVLTVVLAAGACIAILMRSGRSEDPRFELAREFQFDITEIEKIDPELLGYEERTALRCDLNELRAISVGTNGRIYLAGDRAIVVFDSEGNRIASFTTDSEPQCLAVAADGKLYVVADEHVLVLDGEGDEIKRWNLPEKSQPTSVTVSGNDLAIADYSSKSVLHYDTSGELVGQITGRSEDDDRGVRGFVVPSAYFDIAFSRDGLLRVVNPGKLRVEGWTLEGDCEFHWGGDARSLSGFVGCCNPTHIAVFPDGRIVTSEKGIQRVKVYKPDVGYGQNGVLESVVAGPETFEPNSILRDLAAGPTGRVLVLDADAKVVRVFAPKPTGKQERDTSSG